jgi:hypothetical protein
MNRAMIKTLVGACVALAAGVVLAKFVPGTRSSDAANSASAVSKVGSVTANAQQPETALARVVRTETGAKRWLVVLAQAEKAKAEQMPALIRSAGNDAAMIRMLAARWAELDPKHMFASLYADLLQPDGTPGTLPARWVLIDVLFEEWVKQDIGGVVKALNEVPNFNGRDNLRMTVVNRVLKADIEKGLLAMKEWNIRHYVPDMKNVSEWAARDPRHAAEVVAGLGSEYAAREAMKFVGRTWAQSDPEGGLHFALTLNDQSRAALASEIIGAWAQRDLSAAARFATAQENPVSRAAMAQGLVNTWAKSDAAGALAWSQENLRGSARTEAIGGIIKTVAEKDIEAAGDLAAGMEPGAAQNRACASIFETWFNKGKDQRDAALAWLAQLPDPQARNAALDKVQWNWVWNDPGSARDFLSGPYGNLASQSLVNQVARNQAAKNPEAAMEWATGLPADRAADARRAVLDNWLQIRPEGAAAYVLKLPAGKERDAAIGSISQNFMYASTGLDQALAWFQKLPDTDRQTARDAMKHIPMEPERKRKVEEALKGD